MQVGFVLSCFPLRRLFHFLVLAMRGMYLACVSLFSTCQARVPRGIARIREVCNGGRKAMLLASEYLSHQLRNPVVVMSRHDHPTSHGYNIA